MPAYDFHCLGCDDRFELHLSIHEPHPTVHACGGELVQVFASPKILGIRTALDWKFDREAERDIAAYKRLRANGVQPPATKGAAELEARANTRAEVEMNAIFEAKPTRDLISTNYDQVHA